MAHSSHLTHSLAQPLPGALRLELARLEARHLLLVALIALWLLAARVLGFTARWRARARQRAALAGLDERMLRDIGITREVRSAELRKWFWQP